MHWVEPHPPDSPALPGLPSFISSALIRRGITTAETANKFLDPALYSPTPASALPGIEKAVERILSAIRSRERIFIWGDFDVDGQTATTVLVQTLRSLSADVSYHIPVRALEGHGVNLLMLKEVIDRGIQLVLTCDTGITAHEAVEYAQTRGVDVIITDHHDLPQDLPKAFSVVNPKMLPAEHPLSSLAGVGVAYKLMEALLDGAKSEMTCADLDDLAALGLVSDLASVVGDTRYLVQKGLQSLRNTQRLGLKTLFEMTELNSETINESHIGFTIGPRLNALGRLGDANPIVDFFLSDDLQFVKVLALQLENYNAQRQLLTAQVTQAAEAQLRSDPSRLEAPIIIVDHPTWPGGVLGIAAARLVEKYHKPVIVFATPPGQPAHGSARSVEGFHITEAISSQSELLGNFGGHPMAAGLSLPAENLSSFRKGMVRFAEKMIAPSGEKESVLTIDTWLSLPEVTYDLASTIERVSPFGPGNPQLVLACRDLTLNKDTTMGRNKEHRKLTVVDQVGNSSQVFWWNGVEEEFPGGRFDLAFILRKSDWRGSPQLQLDLIAFRNADSGKVTIDSRRLEVIDFRSEKEFEPILVDARKQPSTILWAEGREKSRVGGKDRYELVPAESLVIWSPPPSLEDLKSALGITKPKTIWLVSACQQTDDPEAFLNSLAGVVKYAHSHYDGNVSYEQLAAATGQRVDTVRNGVTWLVANGSIGLEPSIDGRIHLTKGTSVSDPAQAAQAMKNLESLLAETAAFRAHFNKADKDTLFD